MSKFFLTAVLVVTGLVAGSARTPGQEIEGVELPDGVASPQGACVAPSGAGDVEPAGPRCTAEIVKDVSAVFDVLGNFRIGGRLGVGTESPQRAVHVQGSNAVFRLDRDRDTAAFILSRYAPGDPSDIWKAYTVGVNASGPGTGSFVIRDTGTSAGGPGGDRLLIDSSGNVSVDALCLSGECRSAWPPPSPISSITAADGLSGSGTTGDIRLAADFRVVQRRVVETCPEGQFLNGVNLDGTPKCRALSGTPSFLSVNTARVDLPQSGQVRGRLYRGFSSPDGFPLTTVAPVGQASTILCDTGTAGEEACLALNGDYAAIWSPGDFGAGALLRVFDQDSNSEHYRLENTTLRTTAAYETVAGFDLAETFWKSSPRMEPGDVVRVDPRSPDAIVLADREADPSVVGVVSTRPGIVLGGSPFSVGQLVESFGEELALRFEQERPELQAAALRRVADRHAARAERKRVRAASAGAGESMESTGRDEEAAWIAGDPEPVLTGPELEGVELELFFERNFARIALAGRVPVKVDASYGGIEAGDLLVASPTPGHAMRTHDPDPGTVIGKALESHEAGTGRIMMLVMMR